MYSTHCFLPSTLCHVTGFNLWMLEKKHHSSFDLALQKPIRNWHSSSSNISNLLSLEIVLWCYWVSILIICPLSFKEVISLFLYVLSVFFHLHPGWCFILRTTAENCWQNSCQLLEPFDQVGGLMLGGKSGMEWNVPASKDVSFIFLRSLQCFTV